MDPMPHQPSIPHILQVYQSPDTDAKLQNTQIIHISHPSHQASQGKLTYQQTITSKSLHIPMTSHITDIVQSQQMHMSQNQIVMSCQQGQLQSMHQAMHTTSQQVLQSADMNQSLHVILPQVPMLVSEVQQQYYGQYENYQKEQCIVTKVEPDIHIQSERNEKHIE